MSKQGYSKQGYIDYSKEEDDRVNDASPVVSHSTKQGPVRVIFNVLVFITVIALLRSLYV